MNRIVDYKDRDTVFLTVSVFYCNIFSGSCDAFLESIDTPCGINETCKMVDDSMQCVCKAGFKLAPDGLTCIGKGREVIFFK